MNNTYKRVRTKFAPAVRFELKALLFRATQTTGLEKLKDRLLQELLQKAADAETNTLLRRAANDAAALAWTTNYPELLFPELLEEKARAALVQKDRQTRVRKESLNLLLKAA